MPLDLAVWFHPTLQIPFTIDAERCALRISSRMRVGDLLDRCEALFAQESEAAGKALELQISLIWNTKDGEKALDPTARLGKTFSSGEVCCVYGDIVPVRLEPAAQPAQEKIPVTILTGFLGAGKTTLLNYILQEQREKKIVIIENEFGEISIDDALLQQKKVELAEKILVMDNGCLCCTIRGDLINGLLEIIEEVRKGNAIDAIMIETTGLADPVPIVRTFMREPSIAKDLRLDAVITMADARNLLGRLDDDIERGKVNEAYQQIAFADKIILNKLDLVTTEEAMAVKDRIRLINKFAKVLPAIRGRVKMDELADICAHDLGNFANVDLGREAGDVPEAHGHEAHGGHGDHGEQHGHGEPDDFRHGDGHDTRHGEGLHEAGHSAGYGHSMADTRHDNRVNSFAVVKEGEIHKAKLRMWMVLLQSLPKSYGTIYRVKAILAVQGQPLKYVFHMVMDISDKDDAGPWAEGEKKVSKIVFIGKCLDREFLTQSFESLFVETSGKLSKGAR